MCVVVMRGDLSMILTFSCLSSTTLKIIKWWFIGLIWGLLETVWYDNKRILGCISFSYFDYYFTINKSKVSFRVACWLVLGYIFFLTVDMSKISLQATWVLLSLMSLRHYFRGGRGGGGWGIFGVLPFFYFILSIVLQCFLTLGCKCDCIVLWVFHSWLLFWLFPHPVLAYC